uniref:Uncharacterized protein n=1 Tax=Pavo cristatus TaxID=9049 RepID=A0A8C9LC22_PAVCR
MAAEMDFSSTEIPESTVMDNVLHYELFFGAIFQLTHVLAIILPISNKTDNKQERLSLQILRMTLESKTLTVLSLRLQRQ